MTHEMSEHNKAGTHTSLGSADPSRLPDLSGIRADYDENWLDYRLLWVNPRTVPSTSAIGRSTPVAMLNPCSP